MDIPTIVSRVAARNAYLERVGANQALASAGAFVASYVAPHPQLPLAQTALPDGGVNYSVKISPAALTDGQTVPAAVRGSSGKGFIDALY
jgi:hypothetical protein